MSIALSLIALYLDFLATTNQAVE